MWPNWAGKFWWTNRRFKGPGLPAGRARATSSPSEASGRPGPGSGPGTGRPIPASGAGGGPARTPKIIEIENDRGRPVAVAASAHRAGGGAPPAVRREGSPEESTCGAVPASREAGSPAEPRGFAQGHGMKVTGLGPICVRKSKIEPLTVSLPTPTSRVLNTPPRIRLLPPPALEVSKNPPPSSESLPAKPSRVSAAVGPDQRVVAGGEAGLERPGRRVVGVHGLGQGEPHADEVGADEDVVAGPAVERVVARAAEDGVIAAAGQDEVRPARVAERIAGRRPPGSGRRRRRRRWCRCPGRR